MVNLRVRRPWKGDAGSQVLEVMVAMGIAMIAFALAGTVLSGAQRQERINEETSRTVDTARLALASIVNEVREAHSIRMNGPVAEAWFDRDSDGLEDVGEVHQYAFIAKGSTHDLNRIVSGSVRPLATGLASGSFSVAVLENGPKLSMSVTVPGIDDHHSGTTVTSEVSTRGNF